MTIDAFELAWRQWTNEDEAAGLAGLWVELDSKRDQERLVGRLAGNIASLGTVVDVGCGVGGIIPELPTFRRYKGYDISGALIGIAKKRFAADKRCRFWVHDLRDGAPYKRPVDLVVCADVAVHYRDPLALLTRLVHEWPAHHYLLSTAYGAHNEMLVNSHILTRLEVLAGFRNLGEVLAVDERPYGGNYMMIYALLRRPEEN